MGKTNGILAIAAVAVALAASPVAAQQGGSAGQPALGPTIVQSLDDARDTDAVLVSSLGGSFLGAAGGALALNVVTGGAALAPVVGLQTSNVIGGTWLAALGTAPLAGEMAIHTLATAVVAFGGGLAGNYFARD